MNIGADSTLRDLYSELTRAASEAKAHHLMARRLHGIGSVPRKEVGYDGASLITKTAATHAQAAAKAEQRMVALRKEIAAARERMQS